MSRALRPLAAAWLAALGLGGCALLQPRPAWELPPPPVAEGPVVPADRLHRSTLANGLEVLVLEDHGLPRLEVGLLLRRGAEIEAEGEAGAVALMADVMERGAGGLDALALARAVERIGADLGVAAGMDSVSVELSGLSDDTGTLFDLLADVALRPRFDAPEVARARAETLAGFEQEKDDPGALLGRQLARTLYDGHRYGLPVSGAPAPVAGLDAAVLRAMHRRLFVASNAILYVVGDVAEQDALAQVRARFGAWEAGTPPAPGPPPPTPTPPARGVVLVDRPDLGQAQLALAHEGIARTDERRIAAGLMNTILGGGGFLARLMSRVRADEGLAYGIGSGFAMRRHPGPFVVSTSTRAPEAGRVVDIVLEEIERLRREAPSRDELRNARSLSAGRFVLGLETSAAIAGALVELDVYGLPRDSLDTYRTRLNDVTLEEVHEAALRLLHPDRMVIVAVGPLEVLRPQLERFGPVEVVKP
ncbi:MAG: pitrilysin family protein [Deltaproteobacteria bacterium]|nr:pitrilysin family protein [Deltaproteobacteria bacterium]